MTYRNKAAASKISSNSNLVVYLMVVASSTSRWTLTTKTKEEATKIKEAVEEIEVEEVARCKTEAAKCRDNNNKWASNSTTLIPTNNKWCQDSNSNSCQDHQPLTCNQLPSKASLNNSNKCHLRMLNWSRFLYLSLTPNSMPIVRTRRHLLVMQSITRLLRSWVRTTLVELQVWSLTRRLSRSSSS